ncbi:hypothetical protein C5N92_09550 [Glaesserella australis]|uniref:Uncharacterized protein n=2 Tax=Pasteurellaceae TaxID=712 RepID=A0A328BXA3_9PAST|nr:hypothetical protein CJD39_00055 [Glaesserella sp. 15-184]RAL18117.1 hypothetical protein C5N92_09550 [Glaesserella australis]
MPEIKFIKSKEYLVLKDMKFEAKKLKNSSSSIYFYVGRAYSRPEYAISICGNDDIGAFSSVWITFSEIKEFLKHLIGTQFGTDEFNELYQSGNNNNAGFIAAVLLSEKFGVIRKEPNEFKYTVVEDYMNKLKSFEQELQTYFTTYDEKE